MFILSGIHNEPENLSLQSHLSFDMFQHQWQQFVVKKENAWCMPYTYICFVEPTVEYRCRFAWQPPFREPAKMVKIPCTFFVPDASLFTGQRRHFVAVHNNNYAHLWRIVLVIETYTRANISLRNRPNFHFDGKPSKCVIFNGLISGLKIRIVSRF